MAGGRPTKYAKRFCKVAIDLGREGKSKASIAGTIGVTRMTLDNWSVEHPEFFDAMALSRDLALQWWEETAQTHMKEAPNGVKLNSTVWSRSMGARFPDDYRENRKVELDGNLNLNSMTEDEIDQKLRELTTKLSAAGSMPEVTGPDE